MNTLTISREWTDSPHDYENFYKSLSIFGKLNFFLSSKHQKINIWVEAKLFERDNEMFKKAWSKYPDLAAVVKEVQRILEDQIWCFPPNFMPENSYILLGQLLTGGLCDIEGIMAIEEEFGIVLPEDEQFYYRTMLELIEYINKE